MSTLPGSCRVATTGGGLLLGPSPLVVLAYWLLMVLFRYLDWRSGWDTFAPRWCSWRRSTGCEASRSRPWNRRSAPSVTVSLRTWFAVVGSWSALPTLRSIWVWLLCRLLLLLQAVRTQLLRLLRPPLRFSRLHGHRPNQLRGQSRLVRLMFASLRYMAIFSRPNGYIALRLPHRACLPQVQTWVRAFCLRTRQRRH